MGLTPDRDRYQSYLFLLSLLLRLLLPPLGVTMIVVTQLIFVVLVPGHGAMVTPRSRNSIDYLVDVNQEWCSNITGAKCNNGQVKLLPFLIAWRVKNGGIGARHLTCCGVCFVTVLPSQPPYPHPLLL